MYQKINKLFFWGLGISLTLSACSGGEKKEETTTSTDSTATAMTDTVKPMTQEASIDAVTVAPNLYKVIGDSIGIRVLEVTYKPGDSSALHSHPDYALYITSGGTGAFTAKDGQKNVNEMKSNTANIRAAESHSVKNTGKTTLKAILVEVNRPKETISQDPAMDATKVAPDLYKLKKDTLGIRVLEATYKPGQSSALHSHPDNVAYVVNPGTVEFTEKDGTKHTNEFKQGMTLIRPGGVHSVKNTGKTTLKVILVEVNRPMK